MSGQRRRSWCQRQLRQRKQRQLGRWPQAPPAAWEVETASSAVAVEVGAYCRDWEPAEERIGLQSSASAEAAAAGEERGRGHRPRRLGPSAAAEDRTACCYWEGGSRPCYCLGGRRCSGLSAKGTGERPWRLQSAAWPSCPGETAEER